MSKVFEIHAEEWRAAMVAQNKAITDAQTRFAVNIGNIRAVEDAETIAARGKADAAIDKERTAFDDAIEAAQNAYGETLQSSRDRAWAIMQERLRVWNGEVPEELPPAPDLESTTEGDPSLAAFERDPTGGAA